MILAHLRAVLVAALLCVAGTVAAADPLDVPLPIVGAVPGVETAWVTRKMTQNGVPMSVRSFKSSRPVRDVLEEYRRSLLGQGAAHADIVTSSGVNTLGAGLGPYFINVQGADRGAGSAGFIVVSVMPGLIKGTTDTSLPVPEGAHVLSVQRYDEQGKKAESATMASQRSVSVTSDDVKGSLTDRGWVWLPAYSQADTGDKRLLMFKRGHQVLQAVVQEATTGRSRGTLILMTRMSER